VGGARLSASRGVNERKVPKGTVVIACWDRRQPGPKRYFRKGKNSQIGEAEGERRGRGRGDVARWGGWTGHTNSRTKNPVRGESASPHRVHRGITRTLKVCVSGLRNTSLHKRKVWPVRGGLAKKSSTGRKNEIKRESPPTRGKET